MRENFRALKKWLTTRLCDLHGHRWWADEHTVRCTRCGMQGW